MRKLLVVLTAVLSASFILLPIPFAHAADVTALVTAPGDGAIISGTIPVEGRGTSDTAIRKVELFISGDKLASESSDDLKKTLSVSYSWATSGWRNGEYKVTVTADSIAGHDTDEVSVIVDNDAQAPTGLSATTAGKRVNVTWAANSEPDIAGYRVERNSGDGFKAIATVTGTSFSESPGPGNFTYRVVAIRSSVVTEAGNASAPSPASGQITFAAPPTPGGDGDGPGGSGGGKGHGGEGGGDGGPGDTFKENGTSFAGSGLPSSFTHLSAPHLLGLPSTPDKFVWGSYQETLPYELTSGQGPKTSIEDFGIAALSPDRLIPPDGLRWVALGLLMAVMALMLQLISRSLADSEPADS